MPVLLQIDTTAGKGSTGRISETIARLATADGWDCYLAHGCRYAGHTKQNDIKIGSLFEEYLHIAKSLLLDKHGLGSKRATKILLRKIDTIRPDVVQLHCIHGYYLNYKLLFEYLVQNNIPVVWTQHDCWAVTGHCAHFERCGCDRWQTQCHDCPQLSTYPKAITDNSRQNHRLKKELFSSCAGLNVVYVSFWLQSVLEKSFLGQFPSFVFHNGIDISTFSPGDKNSSAIRAKYEIPDKFIVLGVSSQWTVRKGLRHFFELRKKLDERFVIVLVGISREQSEELPDGIIGIQKTDSKEELSALYSAAGVFVNMSSEETFGLVTAEAISCGTPAIVFNSTACPEIVKEGTGHNIELDNIDSVADAVLSEYNKTPKQKELTGQVCRKYAENELDENIRFYKYIELYNKLIGR